VSLRSLTLPKPTPLLLPAPSRAVGVAGFGCAWLAGVYVLLDVVQAPYRLAMLLCILTALLAPLAYKYIRNDLDIFEPIVFANLALGSMFIGRPLFDLDTNTWLHIWFGTFFDARPGFDAMLFYALMGIIALQLGYVSPLPRILARKFPTYKREINPDRMVLIAWGMFGVGAILFEEYVRQSGGVAFLIEYLTSRALGSGFSFKTASGYLFIGPLFWPPAGMIALSAWFRTKKHSYLFLVMLSLTCFFIAMLGGVGRTFTIQGLLGIVIIGYVGRNKRPSMLLILPVAFAVLLFFVYDRDARLTKSLEGKELIAQKIVAHPIQALETIWSEDDAAMSDYFSVIVANVPNRFDYGTGSTVTDVLLRAYPRFLSPDNKKPDEHMVRIFKLFFPAVYYRYSAGAACSLIGELYADHGGVAIVIGMFLFGAILAVPKQWMRNSGGAIPAQLLFVAMPAYTISLMRGGVPAFVEYLAITAFPIILITKYAQGKATRA
jgi:hypothetical protein